MANVKVKGLSDNDNDNEQEQKQHEPKKRTKPAKISLKESETYTDSFLGTMHKGQIKETFDEKIIEHCKTTSYFKVQEFF